MYIIRPLGTIHIYIYIFKRINLGLLCYGFPTVHRYVLTGAVRDAAITKSQRFEERVLKFCSTKDRIRESGSIQYLTNGRGKP